MTASVEQLPGLVPGAPESELAPELGGVLELEELGRRMELADLTTPPAEAETARRLALTRCF